MTSEDMYKKMEFCIRTLIKYALSLFILLGKPIRILELEIMRLLKII